MDFIVVLFFLWIGYSFLRNFMGGGKTGKSIDIESIDIGAMFDNMQQSGSGETSSWKPKSDGPTARGRARLAQKPQISSPWQNAGETKPQLYRPKFKGQKARKASHKNPVQHGRRGRNMDQNRQRHEDWGQRGESGFLSGSGLLIVLAFGFIVLYALSQVTPEMLEQIGL
jgi:membrane protein involved in colicin uptake